MGTYSKQARDLAEKASVAVTSSALSMASHAIEKALAEAEARGRKIQQEEDIRNLNHRAQ